MHNTSQITFTTPDPQWLQMAELSIKRTQQKIDDHIHHPPVAEALQSRLKRIEALSLMLASKGMVTLTLEDVILITT